MATNFGLELGIANRKIKPRMEARRLAVPNIPPRPRKKEIGGIAAQIRESQGRFHPIVSAQIYEFAQLFVQMNFSATFPRPN
jgi:hypothetical protein